MYKNIDLKRAFITTKTTTTMPASSIKHILWYVYFLEVVYCLISTYTDAAEANRVETRWKHSRNPFSSSSGGGSIYNALIIIDALQRESAHFEQVNWANLFATTNIHKCTQSYKHGYLSSGATRHQFLHAIPIRSESFLNNVISHFHSILLPVDMISLKLAMPKPYEKLNV